MMPRVTSRNDSVSVGVTKVMLCDGVVSPNPKDFRQFVYIRNSSTAAQVMTLVFGDHQTITAGNGIVLTEGAAYYEAASEGFEVWQGRIWAICSAANGSAAVIER